MIDGPRAIHAWLERQWYGRDDAHPLLTPCSLLYGRAVALRRLAYRRGWKSVGEMTVPVIVIGNLTVGGTGKTPLVIWLAEFLGKAGFSPGIVSRGYGGPKRHAPARVPPDGDPAEYGDEPLLLARRTGCPVYVFHRRAEAATRLLEECACNLILCDDGLQHYALARTLEIVVVDGQRRFGNGHLLPAGPLRETASRLADADYVVCRGGKPEPGEFPMAVAGDAAVNLRDESLRRPLGEFRGTPVLALAGIGNPECFFEDLRGAGLVVRERPFPDHHVFVPEDIRADAGEAVLMTEKDAVKCRAFAGDNHWYLPVAAALPEAFGEKILNQLKAKSHG